MEPEEAVSEASMVPPSEMTKMMMTTDDAILPETNDSILPKEPHPACPYSFSTCPVMPKSAEELEALQEDGLEQYELIMMIYLFYATFLGYFFSKVSPF